MLDGKHWYPPQKDQVSIGNHDPIDWYEANTWIYCFSPLKQYSQLVKPVSEYNCIHCGKAGKLRSNGWHYHPMHHFHFTVWLLHCQVCCEHARGIRSRLLCFSKSVQQFALRYKHDKMRRLHQAVWHLEANSCVMLPIALPA
jgi:hypothetical protein